MGASEVRRHDTGVLSVAAVKLSLAHAVTIAEESVHGTAVRASLAKVYAGWAYDVQIVKSLRIYHVRLDADTGRVLSTVIDKNDGFQCVDVRSSFVQEY